MSQVRMTQKPLFFPLWQGDKQEGNSGFQKHFPG